MDKFLNNSQNILDLTSNTLVMILAGGRGSRLYELTDKRAKPAVYFGGSCRIIDFALSNCINSNLNRIGVVTQYHAHSLLRHLQHNWSFLPFEKGEFIDMLPARQQLDDSTWYRGTADAVFQNLEIITGHYRPKYTLILAGDHIYKMNYSSMILDHVNSGAKVTVGCIEVKRSQASEFGVMAVNEKLQVTEFIEKPQNPPAILGKPDHSLASMGIYVFDTDYLEDILLQEFSKTNTQHDFGKDIIPQALKEGVLYAHPFERSCMGRNPSGDCYWKDAGTIDAYWESNIDLVSENPQLNIFDRQWPIRFTTKQSFPSKFLYKNNTNTIGIDNSLIGNSCLINDATISNSVLFDNVEALEGASINYSVIMPQVVISKNAKLNKCVVDRRCVIPDGLEIGFNPEEDAKYFRISKGGVTLVTTKMLANYLKDNPLPMKIS